MRTPWIWMEFMLRHCWLGRRQPAIDAARGYWGIHPLYLYRTLRCHLVTCIVEISFAKAANRMWVNVSVQQTSRMSVPSTTCTEQPASHFLRAYILRHAWCVRCGVGSGVGDLFPRLVHNTLLWQQKKKEKKKKKKERKKNKGKISSCISLKTNLGLAVLCRKYEVKIRVTWHFIFSKKKISLFLCPSHPSHPSHHFHSTSFSSSPFIPSHFHQIKSLSGLFHSVKLF